MRVKLRPDKHPVIYMASPGTSIFIWYCGSWTYRCELKPYLLKTLQPWNSPITAEGLLPMFIGLTESFIRSISCSWRLRSRAAFSFASFKAVSKALTRSAVARSRFSILGISPRRSALSLSSCGAEPGLRSVLKTLMMEHVRVDNGFLPVCELFQAVPGCSPKSWSSVSGCCCRLHSPSSCESSAKTTHALSHTRFTSSFIYHFISLMKSVGR